LKPAISIIIPTYNGAQKVVNALQSLEEQTFKDFEVIVVIDGSTDDTKNILETRNFNLPFLKVIYQENKGRSGARNRGAKEAQGELLLFLDDDMRLGKNEIIKHLVLYQKNLSSILMGCAVEEYHKMQTDIQKYKAYLSEKWSRPLGETLKPLSKNNFFLTAANCSMSKQLFFELGGFDEKLTDAEDYDLGKRAIEQNIDIYFDPSIVGWHDDFITCRSYIHRQQQYQEAHKKLKSLYPERYKENQYDYTPAKGIKRLVYRFFSGNFWVDVVDKFNFLLIFPKKLRYKIYDIIITANAIHFPLKF